MGLFKIAVIDSGVDLEHPRLTGCKSSGVSFLKNKQGEIETHIPYNDHHGHGTAVSSIIHRIVPEIEIVSIRLESYDRLADEDLLCYALEWCLKNEDIRIINISLGIPTSSPSFKLGSLCEAIVAKGVFICASLSNDPAQETYPAEFPNIFGVTSGLVKNKLEYGFSEVGAKLIIIAKGGTQRVAWAGREYKITSGNSYAAAHFSGILGRLLLENMTVSFEDTKDLIKANSSPNIQLIQYIKKSHKSSGSKARNHFNKDVIDAFSVQKQLSFASKIAIFPSSEKEMDAVVRFKGLSNFKITLAYDYPRLVSAHQKIELLEQCGILIKKDINDKDFTLFDTLVLGYFLDQLFDRNILMGYALVDKAIFNNKNIITWDVDVYSYVKNRVTALQQHEYTGKLWCPIISDETFDNIIKFRYLPANKAPVLMVVGTSNKQGKVTTQLRIKDIMQKKGYKVSHLSSEPQGALLGASYVFPYGHKGTVYLQQDLWGKFLSAAIKGLDMSERPNIIITGIQSGLTPRDKVVSTIIDESCLASLHYFCGSLPNAVVCVINPEDTIDQIESIIKVIELYSNAKLLFYVLTPYTRKINNSPNNRIYLSKRLSALEYGAQREKMQEILQGPVIDIMDYTNDDFILNSIEDALS